MMVVELIASIPPRKMQFIWLQPIMLPTVMPSSTMLHTMAIVAMMGCMPILSIFLNEKSRPSEKSKNITPMLAHVSMSSWSTTDIV